MSAGAFARACASLDLNAAATVMRILELQLELLGRRFDAEVAVHALDVAVFELVRRNGGLTATLADTSATRHLRSLLSRPLQAYRKERKRRCAAQQTESPASDAPASPPASQAAPPPSLGRGRKACRGCGEVWPSAKRECDVCGTQMYAAPSPGAVPPRAPAALRAPAEDAACRMPGAEYLQRASVSDFLASLRSSTNDGEAGGRVLWLKHHISADAGPAVMDAVLDALAENTLVEVLYMHNFENGMHDAQLDKLMEVLQLGRIWAVNLGKNFGISREAWWRFSRGLKRTNVAHMYASEHVLGVELKTKLIEMCRINRARRQHAPDQTVAARVTHMWWNPPRTRSFPADNEEDQADVPLQRGQKRCSGCAHVCPAAKKRCNECGFVMRKGVADRVEAAPEA